MASKPQFDSLLGGEIEVPIEVDTLKFATARAQEIAAISQALDDAKKGNLIFQRLPRHMRRRVMGHNVKRMPRNLREAYTQQLLKSSGGTLSKHKIPSRKHRRRPANLLEEYNRRQKSFTWLETHIWHAKRFHMTERWGYRLALFPNDRSYRACYRAAANHCLLQDISFLCCIELMGPIQTLLSGLSRHTSPCAGLTFGALSLLDGSREGKVMFYESDQYPNKLVGTIIFFWKPTETSSPKDLQNLWLWVHPAFYQRVVDNLTATFQLHNIPSLESIPCSEDGKRPSESINAPKPKRTKNEDGQSKNVEEIKLALCNVPFERTPKYISSCGNVQMVLLKDTLNRFRLTGPLSQAVLKEALHLVNDEGGINFSHYKNSTASTHADSQYKSGENHHRFWKSTLGIVSPAQLPPKIILSMTVKDPRLQIPDKRTKAVPIATDAKAVEAPESAPPPFTSPIWSSSIRDIVTKSKLSTAELNALRSKLLVPGVLRTSENVGVSGDLMPNSSLEASVNAKVPLLLIQRPGSQNPATKRLGFGCGWDVILPAGWAMPFWLAFIFRGARPAGLREASCHELESGRCEFLPPDSVAGAEEASKNGKELRDVYFRLPPAKRPNFIKLGVVCPFQCEWSKLIRDWTLSSNGCDGPQAQQKLPFTLESSPFFVLRDRKKLQEINQFLATAWSTRQNKSLGRNDKTILETLMSKLPTFLNHESSLLPVCVESLQKGVTEDLSLICLPLSDDVLNYVNGLQETDPVEPPSGDKNHDVRQKLRKGHQKELLRLRRLRVSTKRREEEESLSNNEVGDKPLTSKHRNFKGNPPPTQNMVTAYNKEMEDLWLLDTSTIGSVKNSCSREVAGFMSRGDFSFSEARGCGVGYITYLSLESLIRVWLKHPSRGKDLTSKSENFIVLVRSPKSLQYRPAKISLVID